MAKLINMKSIVAIVAIIVIGGATLESTEAAVHVVGDALGWQNALPNSTYYANWAAARNFTIGDTLIFNFATGVHNVATVRLDDFSDCDTDSDDNIDLINSGPANITLTTSGMQYYICAFPGHCLTGQKLAINVVAATTPSTPSPPSTPTPSTPPPPGTTNTSTPSPPGTTNTSAPSPPGTTITPSSPPPPIADSATSVAANVALMTLMSVAMAFV
ncbi:cucumber peeling cupredoxin-like [Mercurialis annua]|uniref:cucumber peeling cupredoxin-like n=1 Tax=Mercurialis annua TaxID=3986 RepID=UPI00215FE06A|nr:cucumber peeling cupredoxin-like [Mercurialis annua]